MKPTEINLECWRFTRADRRDTTETVTLPHSFNAEDGQDGGADYYRGEAVYETELCLSLQHDRVYLLEVGAAALLATVEMGGEVLCRHRGGYSAFLVDLTEPIRRGERQIRVTVSNGADEEVYPAYADFTFYGGLTRPVRLHILPETHFDRGQYGCCGVLATSVIHGDGATLSLTSAIRNPLPYDRIRYTLTDRAGNPMAEAWCGAEEETVALSLPCVRLWQGVSDPYLYTVRAELVRHNEVLDAVSLRHGFRSFSVDPAKGFLLNGRETPLRGVSRHHDHLGLGSALRRQEQVEDAQLIRQLGANTVRLAHYQHAPQFYDLADEYGFVVWAEIPFISRMSESATANENAMDQLRELIDQNRNHASICFWGISNEITIGGESPHLLSQLKALDALARELDPTRLTTMAQVSLLPIESEQNRLSDLVAYNHYFGWYGGSLSDNEAWLDRFHETHPDRPLGLSEYGCEGILTYHSENPLPGDYSEEYQAVYHEHMLRVISERKWLWGTYVWNLFDFGSDLRDEGGVAGRNNKGLITFDRRIRKDAYYLYQAHWSNEPMLHLCGRRFAKRRGETTTLTVYTNLAAFTLLVNGVPVARAYTDGSGKPHILDDTPHGATADGNGKTHGSTADDTAKPHGATADANGKPHGATANDTAKTHGATADANGKTHSLTAGEASCSSHGAEESDGMPPKYRGNVFRFEGIALHMGMNRIEAEGEDARDMIFLERVEALPPSYTLVRDEEEEQVSNWFADLSETDTPTMTFRADRYSVRDTLDTVLDHEEAGNALLAAVTSMTGMRLKRPMLRMMGGQTVEALLKNADPEKLGISVDAALAHLNRALQEIKRD